MTTDGRWVRRPEFHALPRTTLASIAAENRTDDGPDCGCGAIRGDGSVWLCGFHDGHATGARSADPVPVCDRCHLPIEGDEPHDQLVNGEHVVFHPDCCPDCQENDE